MKLTDLIQEHRIATAPAGHHHTTNGWLNIDCPFCSKDSHRWRMGINLRGNYVSCWSCGNHRLVNVIAALLDIPIAQAAAKIGALERDRIDEEVKPKGKLKLPLNLGQGLFEVHKAYLKRRGFDPDEIMRLWGVRGIGMSRAGMSWRMFIPIFHQGEMVSWTTRTIQDHSRDPFINPHKSAMKYRSASATEEVLPHKDLLYGEDYCRHAVIVNEGPLDAWAVGPGGVATLGMAYSRPQLARIARFPVRVVAFDAEPAAQTRAKRLVRDLEAFPGETYCVTFTTGKDASRASKKEVAELRKRFLGD